ncbi:MAG: hypothetical protein ACJ788_05595 [Ktedonobacteraceae bacterium]
MARKKEPTWITGRQAAAILTEKSGRTINDRYIRRLAESEKIDSKEITNRLKLYSKEDVEAHILSERAGKTRKEDVEAVA